MAPTLESLQSPREGDHDEVSRRGSQRDRGGRPADRVGLLSPRVGASGSPAEFSQFARPVQTGESMLLRDEPYAARYAYGERYAPPTPYGYRDPAPQVVEARPVRTVVTSPAPQRSAARIERPRRNWKKTAILIGGSTAGGAGLGALSAARRARSSARRSAAARARSTRRRRIVDFAGVGLRTQGKVQWRCEWRLVPRPCSYRSSSSSSFLRSRLFSTSRSVTSATVNGNNLTLHLDVTPKAEGPRLRPRRDGFRPAVLEDHLADRPRQRHRPIPRARTGARSDTRRTDSDVHEDVSHRPGGDHRRQAEDR